MMMVVGRIAPRALDGRPEIAGLADLISLVKQMNVRPREGCQVESKRQDPEPPVARVNVHSLKVK